MRWFGDGGESALPVQDELPPTMEAEKPKTFVAFKLNPGGAKKAENDLILIDDAALLGITPGLTGPKPPDRISVLLTEKQYSEMVADAQEAAREQKLVGTGVTGLVCKVEGIIKSTDARATLSTTEALGLTGYKRGDEPQEHVELPGKLEEQLGDIAAAQKAKKPEGKEEIPV